MSNHPYIYSKAGKTYIEVVISPNSKKDKIIGVYGDRLKISITAPPVDGKANSELIKFLAKTFKCPKSYLSIYKGQTSKQKTILLENLDLTEVLLICAKI